MLWDGTICAGAGGIARLGNLCIGAQRWADRFSKESPWRPPSLLLEADPPLHDRTRGLMNRITAVDGVRALQEEWQAKADSLVLGLNRARHD